MLSSSGEGGKCGTPSARRVEVAEQDVASSTKTCYTLNIVMATSIHLPKGLLSAVDRRARQLKISRNRFIVRALQEELARSNEWSPGFFEGLATGAVDRAAVEEMLGAIRAGRTAKKPLDLAP
jgi:predicted transcriptional regulator